MTPQTVSNIQKEKEKKKKNIRKVIISVLIISLLCPLSIFINRRFFRTTEKQYTTVSLRNIKADYRVNSNMNLLNSLSITPSTQNNYYVSSDTLIITKIKDVADKLGLTIENQNTRANIYGWGTNIDLKGDRIIFDSNDGTVDIRYNNGINQNNKVDKDNAYKFLADLFQLGTLDVKDIKQTQMEGEDYQRVIYTASYDNKKVYFQGVSETAALVEIFEGKIFSAFLRVIPSNNFVKSGELKPLSEIKVENLVNLYYTNKTEQDKPINSGPLGSEGFTLGDISVVLKDYEECYFYYFDGIQENVLMLPALKIKGQYQDKSKERGTLHMVVINEDTSALLTRSPNR